jgi:hypothetical protein
MRSVGVLVVFVGLLLGAGTVAVWGLGSVRVRTGHMSDPEAGRLWMDVSCKQSYYYLLRDCCYVTVLEGIGEDESYGVCFDMLDTVYWYPPCDTSECRSLDVIELVLYDVLAPPTDQAMNIKVIGAGSDGEPTGDLLGNLDFTSSYTESAAFTSIEVDFTNGGVESGLDLSGCGGRFVAILTWKNPTGHPALVLDNISTCMDSCSVNAACCDMGLYPYLCPRNIHTYYYGTEGAWSKQDSIGDPGGSGVYGCVEALWMCGFCTKGTATEPTTWGGIKALYR